MVTREDMLTIKTANVSGWLAPIQWMNRLELAHDTSYYKKCAAGGVLSCGVMHTLITPLDVVKCNLQVNPSKYKSVLSGLQLIMREEGARGIWKGWGPTLVGYSSQGAFKFGLYEYFKDAFSAAAGPENAHHYRSLIYVAAGGSAECIADIFMCPWEMMKVKMQTSPAGTFPTDFGPALRYMYHNPVETGFPFGSMSPLWGRQIPYAIAKFGCFENIVEGFYTHLLTEPKETYNKPLQLGVTFVAGYMTGTICGIISHPADSLVSLMSKAEHKGKSAVTIASEVGLVNLMTKGLGSRLIMVGALTGVQWWTYDAFKTVMGMGTTSGISKQH